MKLLGDEMDILTQILRALGDPTRRAVLGLLSTRNRSVTDLAEHFSMSRPAVSKHLGILRDAGLVKAQRDGRKQIYQLDASTLRPVREWLEPFRPSSGDDPPRREIKATRSPAQDWKCW